MNEVFKIAHWIAPEGAKTSAEGNIVAWFRFEFELPDDIGGISLKLAISAHTRYKLTVNDAPIAIGPRKANDKKWFYDQLENSSALKPGANVILAKVVSFAPIHNPKNIGKSPISVLTLPLAPMLLAAGGVYADEKQLLDVTTGRADWRAAVDGSVEWIGHEQTHYLGDLERWRFSRRALEWKCAVPAGYPLTNEYGEMQPMMLSERAIPLMAEEDGGFIRQMPCKNGFPLQGLNAGSATEILRNASVSVELDAGELTTAYMTLSGLGGKGAVVRVHYAECYKHKDAKGNRIKAVRDEPCEGGLDGAYDELLIDGGEWRFESFWFRTFIRANRDRNKGGTARLECPAIPADRVSAGRRRARHIRRSVG